MPFALLKYGLSRKYPVHGDIPPTPDLKPSYDVVIVGGGGHGLASAHYLAKYWGITNVAVFEKGYLAGGNTARNTTAVRSNYMTQDSIRFYRETVQLFEGLSQELGFNVMFAQRGQFTLDKLDGDSWQGSNVPPNQEVNFVEVNRLGGAIIGMDVAGVRPKPA